jgi:hypothetical protein
MIASGMYLLCWFEISTELELNLQAEVSVEDSAILLF